MLKIQHLTQFQIWYRVTSDPDRDLRTDVVKSVNQWEAVRYFLQTNPYKFDVYIEGVYGTDDFPNKE